jgi:SAM-dependent methyltransferase
VRPSDQENADLLRSRVEEGRHDPQSFRAALLSVAPSERDAWIDRLLGLRELPEDGPDLPRGGVPYMPCAVDALLRMVEEAEVISSDVFVDVGSGLGRATSFVHLFTGADAIGIEIQSALASSARELAARLSLSRVSSIEGDAAAMTEVLARGSVFFFYCPFGGDRLARVLRDLEAVAHTKAIRICCLDLPLPPCPWLTRDPSRAGDLTVYRSAQRT